MRPEGLWVLLPPLSEDTHSLLGPKSTGVRAVLCLERVQFGFSALLWVNQSVSAFKLSKARKPGSSALSDRLPKTQTDSQFPGKEASQADKALGSVACGTACV